jgi:hypothetical protein
MRKTSIPTVLFSMPNALHINFDGKQDDVLSTVISIGIGKYSSYET